MFSVSLTEAGKEVLFVFDVPTLASDFRYWDRTKVNQCTNTLGSVSDKFGLSLRGKLIRLQHHESLEQACTMEEQESGTFDAHYMMKDVISNEALNFKNVKTIDLSELLCDNSGRCSIQKDGKVIFADGHHLNFNGSLFAAPILLKALQSN